MKLEETLIIATIFAYIISVILFILHLGGVIKYEMWMLLLPWVALAIFMSALCYSIAMESIKDIVAS